MPNIVEISDFTGKFKIATDQYTETEFEAFRDERQFDMIYEMLGAVLGAAFIADLNSSGVPVSAPYTTIFAPFVANQNGCLIRSEGIKKMVRNDLFVKWARENGKDVNLPGNSSSEQENSTPVLSVTWIVLKYNQAIDTARAIQWYIGKNSADFPYYNGQEMEYMSIY